MEFRKIDRSNYGECMELTVDDSQKDFVADNKQSLVEAAYEENLYTLGIYCQDTMVGFILYDYDDQIPGWSMSRFMIGKQYQGKGYGKQAALEFLDDFHRSHSDDPLFISVSLENTVARKMYSDIGLGQFTRNYTQTVKRAADNKRRYAPGWVHSTCLLRGFPKGAAPHLAHDFAEQSVVCYTLCRRCPENTVAAGEGKGI